MTTAQRGRRRTSKNGLKDKLIEHAQYFFARRIIDTIALVLAMAGVFLSIALLSYDKTDPSWNTAVSKAQDISNFAGYAGATSADIMFQTIGAAAFILPLACLVWACKVFRRLPIQPLTFKLAGLLSSMIFMAIALSAFSSGEWLASHYIGGAGGTIMLNWISSGISGFGLTIPLSLIQGIAGILGLICLFPALGLTRQHARKALTAIFKTIAFTGFVIYSLIRRFIRWLRYYNDPDYKPGFDFKTRDILARLSPLPASGSSGEDQAESRSTPSAQPLDVFEPAPVEKPTKPKNKNIPVVAKMNNAGTSATQHRFALEEGEEWILPSLDLIELPRKQREEQPDEQALRKNAELLQNVLADFKVEGDIVSIHPGPVVTLYELEPAPGTKSSRVIGLSDDIARSMSAVSVRSAVVPGRNVIGIELPNKTRQIVYMHQLLASSEFTDFGGKLPLILGKTIGGVPILADLAKMPHLLVAGTTGSGKSVAVNTMILSLLYRLSPEQCRFIMIDPKMLELSVYDGIPHLLSPVVTEPGKAVVALKWVVQEMEDRYRAMSRLGVRNIEGYNKRLAEARKTGETIMQKVSKGFNPETGEEIFEDAPMDLNELPYIVVVVDEFADLMLVAGKDVENAIQRLAQMARAAGIHLIMATQRPSVDVITGVIKANFPTRISFSVTSKIDSRTILGEAGAEQLLGMGDMLYMAPGGQITRVHGPFVSDKDVEKVVKFLKQQGEPHYVDNITEDEGFEGGSDVMNALFSDSGGSDSVDELYDQAVAIVARERKASTSFIQRQLQIGYNRAARIIEEMERQGVISKANATGKREILISDHSG